MIAVSRFEVAPEGADAFAAQAQEVLRLLAQQPGFVRGRLGRSVDDGGLWSLVTEWDSVGSYRRGIGAYDVKLTATPLMAWGVPEPSAFEVIASCDDPQPPAHGPSGRAR